MMAGSRAIMQPVALVKHCIRPNGGLGRRVLAVVFHEHLGDCGEGHTACKLLGARDTARELAGNRNGPNGKKVADIAPHPKDGLGGWRPGNITCYLKTGFLPAGDFAGGTMVEVIESTASRSTDADRAAISVYLLSLPPTPGP